MIINPSSYDSESTKIAVAIRGARAIVGLSQAELAELIGISKVTLARVETLETPIKADSYLKALKVFKERGVMIDSMLTNTLNFTVADIAIEQAFTRLQDESKRRSDRKKLVKTDPELKKM